MSISNWMPVYTRDILASCADMSASQFGGYMRLLLWAWDSNGLPNDMEACCRIAGGLTPGDWQVIRRRLVVLDAGTADERLSHPRLEREREKAESGYARKIEALAKARRANPKNGRDQSIDQSIDQSTDQSIDQSTDQSTDTQPQPQPQPHCIKNESPSEILRPTRRQPRQSKGRTYRISWSSDGGFQGISADDRCAWGNAYPGVDLAAEIAKAHVYLRENPAKAGRRNWGAFLARWFSRVQERGGNAQPQQRTPEKRFYCAEAGRSVTLDEYDRIKAQARNSPARPVEALDGIRPALKPIAPENAN